MAGVQLILAFALDCLERSIHYTWQSRSAALEDAIRVLGVGALLESPGGLEHDARPRAIPRHVLRRETEGLDSMESALLKFSGWRSRRRPHQHDFPRAHSIKGGSATFGFADVAAFTHIARDAARRGRAGKRRVDPALVDVLLRSGD